MASQGRTDARGTLQLLASTALECIDDPNVAQEQEVALNNVYRLLESYRVSPFFASEAPSQIPLQVEREKLTLQGPLERNVREVRDAIAHALTTAFNDANKDEAVERIGTVLRSVAYPHQVQAPSADDHQRTTRFFREVIDRLEI